jgi:hypothetical protein
MINKKYKKLNYRTKELESLSTSELQKIADYSLRQYLLRNSENVGNYYWCPIKEKSYPSNKMHVAHFHDRHRLNTRYSLDNCFLISEQSNKWDSQVNYEGYKSKHHYEYEIWLRKKIGEENFENLLADSKKLVIFAKEDYIKLINKFRNE